MEWITGIVLIGAIGLLLRSLTLANQLRWTRGCLPPEIAGEVERVRSAMGERPDATLAAKVQLGGSGNRSPGNVQASREHCGNSEE
jgi:hypothetical protein